MDAVPLALNFGISRPGDVLKERGSIPCDVQFLYFHYFKAHETTRVPNEVDE